MKNYQNKKHRQKTFLIDKKQKNLIKNQVFHKFY